MDSLSLESAISVAHARLLDAEERLHRVKRERPDGRDAEAVTLWMIASMDAQTRLSEEMRSLAVLQMRALQYLRKES